jgi:hypothetical protein
MSMSMSSAMRSTARSKRSSRISSCGYRRRSSDRIGRYVIAAEAEARADADQPFGVGLARFDGLQHLIDVVVDSLCPRVDRLAFVGDRARAARAVEELDLQMRFEDRDALCRRRQRSAQLVGRRRERTQPRGGPEYAKVLEKRESFTIVNHKDTFAQ